MNLPSSFILEFPEIYQIEVSSKCNFKCIMCPRSIYKRKDMKPFLDIKLIHKLLDEGAFRGSYFVELQMSGEPLLHPNLLEIIKLLKSYAGIKIGLSTNGSLITNNLKTLSNLDYITISVDSMSNYSNIRVNGDFNKLMNNIDLLKNNTDASIDLQVIELENSDWKETKKFLYNKFPTMNVRSIPNCFLTITHEGSSVSKNICLNPWLSCSIQSNGNVVPCCFSFWDDIIYGNLYNQSLKEIWNGDAVKKLRYQHETKCYENICSRCYMRSPVLLHWELFTKSFRSY